MTILIERMERAAYREGARPNSICVENGLPNSQRPTSCREGLPPLSWTQGCLLKGRGAAGQKDQWESIRQ